jgi:polysaccharide biosynthesis/export protein
MKTRKANPAHKLGHPPAKSQILTLIPGRPSHRPRWLMPLLCACLAAVGLAAPTRAQASPPDSLAGTNTTLFRLEPIAISPAPLASAGYVADAKYRLRVGDRVSYQVLEDREPPRSLVVADSGELDLPYLGRVAAIDKSCKQLVEELKTRLEKEYYYRATVILALDSANRFGGRVYVWGQVKQQGPVDLPANEQVTVARAILRAGGFADFANRKRVKLVRATAGPTSAAPDPKGKQVFELNLAEILDDGKPEKDMVLQPDDAIIVPSRLINF